MWSEDILTACLYLNARPPRSGKLNVDVSLCLECFEGDDRYIQTEIRNALTEPAGWISIEVLSV